MKKAIASTPWLLLLLLGCKKSDVGQVLGVPQVITFNVNVSQTTRVPRPSYFYTGLPAPVTVTTNSASAFQTNNTNRDKIKEVYLDQMLLTLTPTPAVPNFDFLDTLRVYVNTPGANNRILLSQIANPPSGMTTLTLTPTTARLDEYLKSDRYQLTVYSRQRSTGFVRDDSITVRTDSRFRVKADPL